MTRTFAWFGIAIAIAWLVIVGGGWLGIYTSALRVITLVVAAVVLGTWAVVAWRKPAWRPRSVLMPAILACLASMAISTVFSRIPRISVEYLGYSILLAALYLLLVRLLADPSFRGRLVSLGVVLFVVIAVEFVAVIVWLWIGWWQELGHLAIPPLRPHFIGLTYGNPSAVLTIVSLLAIPAAARYGSWRPRGMLAFVGIVAIVGVVALLSGSRAGWLAIGITGVVAIVALAADRERREIARAFLFDGEHLAHHRARRVAVPVIGLAIVAAAIVLLPAIISRIDAGGEDLRSSYAAVAIRLFLQSPIVGSGPGTWTIERIANTHQDETDYYIPHAHDVPVQTLAELGVVGALAGLFLILSVAALLRAATRATEASRRRMAWLTGLGLLYFGLHQILDFYPNMPAALFAAALPVAWLDATAAERPAPLFRALVRISVRLPGRALRLAPAAGLLLVVFANVGVLVSEGPATQLDQATAAANSGDWQSALEPAIAAANTDPDVAPYQFVAGLALDRVGDHAGAATYFRNVANRDDLPEAWLNLAAEQVTLGLRDDAIASVRRALRLGAQRVEVLMPAGDLAMRLGDRSLATRSFADAITIEPTLAGDPWWGADPTRAAALPGIVPDAERQIGGAGAWQVALMAGDLAQARAFAGTSSVTQTVIDAWVGDQVAVDRLIESCRASPLDIGILYWCALVEAHLGDQEAADRYRAGIDVVSAGSSIPAHELRVNTEPVTGPTFPQSRAWYWGLYTYRRAIPNDMLVPSLVHLIAT